MSGEPTEEHEAPRAELTTLMVPAAITVIGALAFLLVIYRRRADLRLPPERSGWIPWLGVAIPFGKAPLHYIKECRNELGDIFTIHAAGKRMTFLCSSSDHAHFFQTPHADFQAAVQPFTENAAGIPQRSFFQYHTTIHDTIKGRLTPQYMAEMCPALSQEFYHHLCEGGRVGKEDLLEFVRSAMFPGVVRYLFGPKNMSMSKEEMKKLQTTFAKYDLDFEYGAELPSFLLREWSGYKQWLLNFFTAMVGRTVRDRDEEPQRVVDHLLKCVDSPSAPGYALLLLWASQANAIPISFWAVAFILAHPDVHSAIKEELKDWKLVDETGQFQPVKEEELRNFPTVKRALLEAIRLRSPGTILRKVTKTHTIKGFTIPRGHLLMVSLYWSHRDPALFPSPDTFNPARWEDCELVEKNQFLPGFIGFGGGRYQCPGRWFALMELHLFVAMILKMFDMQLLDEVPQPSPLHLVGSQQPLSPCRVKFRRLF